MMYLTQILKSKNWQPLFLIILVGIVYCPIFKNDFLYDWDDQWMVMNHYTVNGWTIENLWNLFTNFFHSQYSPFTELNYILLFSIGGYNPFIFHLASLIWHICNTLLVWYLLKRLLKISKIGEESDRDMIAFFTAFLFGIHPMNVESVAWISAVKVLIYAFFYLLGLLAYVKYVETKKTIHYVKSMIFFICSFLGKEQAVTFPLFLLIIDWFTNRNLKSSFVWIEKIPFFLLALSMGLTTLFLQVYQSNSLYLLWQRIIWGSYALFEYFTKGILPFHLNYLYPFPMTLTGVLPSRFFFYPILIFLVICFLYINRNKKYLLLGFLIFIVNLVFSINIIHMSRMAIVADRYFYLSGIGITFLISYFSLYLIKLFLHKRSLYRFLVCIILIYILYLGSYTHIYSKQWESSDTIRTYMNELLEKQRTNYKLGNI